MPKTASTLPPHPPPAQARVMSDFLKVECPYVEPKADRMSSFLCGAFFAKVPFRCLVIGPTHSGKSTLVKSIVTCSDMTEDLFASFHNYTVFSQSGAGGCWDEDRVETYEALPPLKDLMSAYYKTEGSPPKQVKSLAVVFDDVPYHQKKVLDVMIDYFRMGRHWGVSCFLISQDGAPANSVGLRSQCEIRVVMRMSQARAFMSYIEKKMPTVDFRFVGFNSSTGRRIIKLNQALEDSSLFKERHEGRTTSLGKHCRCRGTDKTEGGTCVTCNRSVSKAVKLVILPKRHSGNCAQDSQSESDSEDSHTPYGDSNLLI